MVSICDFHKHTQNWGYASVWECTRSTGLRHWWRGDKKSLEVSIIIKDGGVCDFHKRTQNYGYVLVCECTNKYRRNLPTYNVVIMCIRSAGLRHWWKGDQKSLGVSTIIKDGGICGFQKNIQNWELTSAQDYMVGCRRIITTYNVLVMCIRGAVCNICQISGGIWVSH
jgi:hypothetical protein